MTNPSFQDFLPQGPDIQALKTQINSGRMVHSLLVTGEGGTGKRTLARLLAAALLCQEESGRPCGRCSSCRRTFDNEHPDLIRVEKGTTLTNDARKSRTTIPVDDIREIKKLSSAYPLEGKNRVILILNAEDMTIQAQNSLLKILEEPPENNYFILTSGHPEQLLLTVRSRCRNLKMKPWDEKDIRRILTEDGTEEAKARQAARASRGSIGYAKQLASDDEYWQMREKIIRAFFGNNERSQILPIASEWKENKADADKLFDILEECVRTMLDTRLGIAAGETGDAFSAEWKQFAEKAELGRFIGLAEKVREARKEHSYNVNIQAIVEHLLLYFMGEIRK